MGSVVNLNAGDKLTAAAGDLIREFCLHGRQNQGVIITVDAQRGCLVVAGHAIDNNAGARLLDSVLKKLREGNLKILTSEVKK